MIKTLMSKENKGLGWWLVWMLVVIMLLSFVGITVVLKSTERRDNFKKDCRGIWWYVEFIWPRRWWWICTNSEWDRILLREWDVLYDKE